MVKIFCLFNNNNKMQRVPQTHKHWLSVCRSNKWLKTYFHTTWLVPEYSGPAVLLPCFY